MSSDYSVTDVLDRSARSYPHAQVRASKGPSRMTLTRRHGPEVSGPTSDRGVVCTTTWRESPCFHSYLVGAHARGGPKIGVSSLTTCARAVVRSAEGTVSLEYRSVTTESASTVMFSLRPSTSEVHSM
jgi:hypothetical protein